MDINKGNLNSMADDAKKKLKEQLDNGTDIYANIRAESEKSSNVDKKDNVDAKVDDEKTQQKIKIKNIPDEEDLDYNTAEPILAYDEPLFAGGPTVTEIESWKKLWDGYDILAVNIMEQYFVFRTLNRFEYKQIVALKNTDPIQREEIFCETCTLWPDEYNYKDMAVQKAGIPSTYAQIIMEKSGFTKEYSVQVL